MSADNQPEMIIEQTFLFQIVGRDFYLIPSVLIVCLSVIGNLAAIVLTLLSPRLRKTTKHLVILNISVVSLLQNCLPDALIIELYARNQWIHGCEMLFVIDVASMVIVAIYILLMTSLCVEWIMSSACQNCSHTVKYVITSVMLGFCWVASCLVLIPLAIEGRITMFCGFVLERDFNIAVICLQYFPQASLTFVSVISVVIYYVKRRSTSSDRSQIPPFPTDVVAASCITVIFNFPLVLWMLIANTDTFKYYDRLAFKQAHAVTLPLSLLPYAIVPFVWLACRETREAIAVIFRKSRDTYVTDEIQYPMDSK